MAVRLPLRSTPRGLGAGNSCRNLFSGWPRLSACSTCVRRINQSNAEACHDCVMSASLTSLYSFPAWLSSRSCSWHYPLYLGFLSDSNGRMFCPTARIFGVVSTSSIALAYDLQNPLNDGAVS